MLDFKDSKTISTIPRPLGGGVVQLFFSCVDDSPTTRTVAEDRVAEIRFLRRELELAEGVSRSLAEDMDFLRQELEVEKERNNDLRRELQSQLNKLKGENNSLVRSEESLKRENDSLKRTRDAQKKEIGKR